MSGRASLEDRFWAKVDRRGDNDCWPWLASRGTAGYGQFGVGKRTVGAHRVAYELTYGPIPRGRMIDHRCHVRECVNPAHLQAVTNQQNLENRRGAMARSASGVRGVGFHKKSGKWRAVVKRDGKHYHAGLFETMAGAEVAAIELRNRLMTNNLADRAAA